MKRLLSLLAKGLLASCLLLGTSGCKKAFDYLDHNTDNLNLCRIKTFSGLNPYSSGSKDAARDIFSITYNYCGDPVSILRNKVGTGSTDFLFRYDKQGRLTDLIGVYDTSKVREGDDFERWYRYYYDAQSRIAYDTLYFFGTLINGRPHIGEHGMALYTTFLYDSKNRVINSTQNTVTTPSYQYILNYSYDENGNRTGRIYDNKINFRRTNKIWMFLDADYSINNMAPQTGSYNYYGLPTYLNYADGGMDVFMLMYYYDAQIEYSCK